jgi:hypothetical protein
MAKVKDSRKVWFVEFPTYRYNEDVKELARKDGLKIVNARFKPADGEKTPFEVIAKSDAPKLTLKKEFRPKESK